MAAATVTLLAFASMPTAAQKHCSKGIPCGNTCISAKNVCHIGASPSAANAATGVVANSASTPPAAPLPLTTGGTIPAATAGEYAWVGSFADGVYFRADCPAAQDLAPANRRYFRTIQDAEGAGFRRSRTPGC